MKKFLIFFLLLSNAGYNTMPSNATKILSEDLLVKIIVDLELTRTLIYNDLADNDALLVEQIFQEQQALIFSEYAIDQSIFQHSYEHFLRTPAKFKLLQEAVITQLEKMLQEMKEDDLKE